MKQMSIPDRLAVNRYVTDEAESHIEVNQVLAKSTGTGKVLVEYAACLECGTCLAVAAPGSLTWHYPRGGFGIQYREG
jgi:ferredoxin like protein